MLLLKKTISYPELTKKYTNGGVCEATCTASCNISNRKSITLERPPASPCTKLFDKTPCSHLVGTVFQISWNKVPVKLEQDSS